MKPAFDIEPLMNYYKYDMMRVSILLILFIYIKRIYDKVKKFYIKQEIKKEFCEDYPLGQ